MINLGFVNCIVNFPIVQWLHYLYFVLWLSRRRASSWADSVITLLRRLYLIPALKEVIDQYLSKCVTVAQLSEVFKKS